MMVRLIGTTFVAAPKAESDCISRGLLPAAPTQVRPSERDSQ